jgi:polyferredoxin
MLLAEYMMKKIFSVRTMSQLAVLIVVLYLSITHMVYGIEKAAPIDAFCPFGAVEGALTYISSGKYINRINASSFIIFFAVVIMTFFFGRVFCGFFCPLGALQEWIRAIGRKIGIRKEYELPPQIDRILRYLKYVILFILIYFTYRYSDLVFRTYDPYNALMHLGYEIEEKWPGYLILGIVLVSSLFVKSLWCRYFCPLGAILGIIRKISPFSIERDNLSCVHCQLCVRTCPANLPVESAEKINSADCVSCLRCISDCSKGSLSAKVMGRKIDKKILQKIVAFLFLLLLVISPYIPGWKTNQDLIKNSATGNIDIDAIRGSNTLKHVIETTGISKSIFIKELGIPGNIDGNIMLKDIGVKYNIKNKEGNLIETEDFREIIRKSKNQ